ncbi:MAG: DUF2490 domain-containing protein [Bacteroidales bacterium]|nr:DUF2490 domain-containing protein [Bacteroidales bacterium]
MKRLAYILILFAIPAFLQGRDKDDFGIWSSITSSYRISDNWTVGLLLEHRSLDNTRNLDCAYIMPSVEYRICKFLKAGLASEYVMCGNKTTQLTARPYITFGISSGPLSVSLRELPIGEYTFETKEMKWTSRTRLKAAYSIESLRIEPYLAMEIFVRDGWQKTRNYIGSEIALGKHSYADIYYMYYIMAGKTYQRHVLGLGYGIRF